MKIFIRLLDLGGDGVGWRVSIYCKEGCELYSYMVIDCGDIGICDSF